MTVRRIQNNRLHLALSWLYSIVPSCICLYLQCTHAYIRLQEVTLCPKEPRVYSNTWLCPNEWGRRLAVLQAFPEYWSCKERTWGHPDSSVPDNLSNQPFFSLFLLENVPRNDRLITLPALYLFLSHLFIYIILLVWDSVLLLYSPGYPGSYYIVQTDLKLIVWLLLKL